MSMIVVEPGGQARYYLGCFGCNEPLEVSAEVYDQHNPDSPINDPLCPKCDQDLVGHFRNGVGIGVSALLREIT